MLFETIFNDKTKQIDLDLKNSAFVLDNKEQAFTFENLEGNRYLLRLDRKIYQIDNVTFNGQKVEFTLDGNWISVNVRDEQTILLDRLGFKSALGSGEGHLNAPMPGKILEILCKTGDQVKLGDPVIILEAMKMENELKSPADGVIKSINIATGQSVEKNEFLLEVETVG